MASNANTLPSAAAARDAMSGIDELFARQDLMNAQWHRRSRIERRDAALLRRAREVGPRGGSQLVGADGPSRNPKLGEKG
jgi:hypothetical protein